MLNFERCLLYWSCNNFLFLCFCFYYVYFLWNSAWTDNFAFNFIYQSLFIFQSGLFYRLWEILSIAYTRCSYRCSVVFYCWSLEPTKSCISLNMKPLRLIKSFRICWIIQTHIKCILFLTIWCLWASAHHRFPPLIKGSINFCILSLTQLIFSFLTINAALRSWATFRSFWIYFWHF